MNMNIMDKQDKVSFVFPLFSLPFPESRPWGFSSGGSLLERTSDHLPSWQNGHTVQLQKLLVASSPQGKEGALAILVVQSHVCWQSQVFWTPAMFSLFVFHGNTTGLSLPFLSSSFATILSSPRSWVPDVQPDMIQICKHPHQEERQDPSMKRWVHPFLDLCSLYASRSKDDLFQSPQFHLILKVLA